MKSEVLDRFERFNRYGQIMQGEEYGALRTGLLKVLELLRQSGVVGLQGE